MQFKMQLKLDPFRILHLTQVGIVLALVAYNYISGTVLYGLFTEKSFSGSGELAILDDTIYLGSASHFMFIVYSQLFLILHILVAFILIGKEFIGGNKYGIHHASTLFWLGSFTCYLFGHKTVVNYLVGRWDFDSRTGQLGYMQAIFLKGSSIKDYVLAFEQFQTKHACCAIFNNDDWNFAKVWNENDPVLGFDYTLGVPPPERIYRIGTCNNKTLSNGCGNLMLDHVTNRLGKYAGYLVWEFAYGVILALLIGWFVYFVTELKKQEKLEKKAEYKRKILATEKAGKMVAVVTKEKELKKYLSNVGAGEKKTIPEKIIVDPKTGYVDHPEIPKTYGYF